MVERGELTMTAELHYRDPSAALAWLAGVFGFQTRMIVANELGEIVFAETGLADVAVAVVPEQPDARLRSPRSLGGSATQLVRVRGILDVEGHHRHARDAGATIVQPPTRYFFGDLVYLVADLEGHVWSFAQRLPDAGPPPDGWTVTFPSPPAD